MISVSLPPVFAGWRSITHGEFYEAFAMSYWAGYNDVPISARVMDSQRRAWGVFYAKHFPRELGVRPGMIHVRVGTPDEYRTIIAIEGMASISQILGTSAALDPTGFNGIGTPSVVNAFFTAAAACATELLADTEAAADLNSPGRIVTYTGHSQGAAIADIFARQRKAALPNKQIRCIKFASPRVGTSRYVSQRPASLMQVGFYTDGDCIGSMPVINYAAFTPLNINPRNQLVYYVDDEATKTLNINGTEPESGHEFVSDVRWIARLRYFTHTPLPSNPWYSHTADFYKMCMTAWAVAGNDEFAYRMRWLDWEDDYKFGQTWTPGAPILPAKSISDPLPADVPPPNEAIRRMAIDDGHAAGDWGGERDPIADTDGDTLGGNWGETQPVIETAQRRQRRTRRVQAH